MNRINYRGIRCQGNKTRLLLGFGKEICGAHVTKKRFQKFFPPFYLEADLFGGESG